MLARYYPFLLCLTLGAWTLAAQGIISTVAGDIGFPENVPAIQTRLEGLQGIAVDQAGAVYFGSGLRIRRIDR
jgi:hypothetical protein